jgi:cation:H+ antiporter
LFAGSLAVTLLAARLFARRLDRLGTRYGFPEALIGLLTALAADGPEISSALFALFRGAHGVSVGVLVGSNAFNLAAMIGLSGILAGSIRLRREALLLDGLIGVAITLVATALLLRWLPPAIAAVLAACALLPYLLLVVGGSELLIRRPLPGRIAAPLAQALAPRPRPEQPWRHDDPARHLVVLAAIDVALIVAGSAGMVQAALVLGDRLHLSGALLGVLVLAPLTSIPNAITGLRLGVAGRSAALVGETFNSNTINLAAGLILPSLFTALVALDAAAKVQLAWLVAMTVGSVAALARPCGMRRAEAFALVLAYLGFAMIQIATG